MIKGAYIVGEEAYTAEKFEALEKVLDVVFPKAYKDFIIEMKGAKMDYKFIESFEEEFSFSPIDIFASNRDVAMVRFFPTNLFFDLEYREVYAEDYALPKKLIPFADEGAGRQFCFDFDKEIDGKVPIIIIMPDADEEVRGRYIADDFEQFLEMIGNPNLEAPYYHVPYYDVEEVDNTSENTVFDFLKHREFLEFELTKKPFDVAITCQLANIYFELGESLAKSIEVLENLLDTTLQLSEEERSMIYTNLSFFYKRCGLVEKCFSALQTAVAFNPKEPNAYDALGKIYCSMKTGDLSYYPFEYLVKNTDLDYLLLFEKACSLSDKWQYHYNYGVALYTNKNIKEAKKIFEQLLLRYSENVSIKYATAICCAYLGEFERARNYAFELSECGELDNIDYDDVANIFYLCNDFNEYIKTLLKLNIQLANESEWLENYFYAYKQVMGIHSLKEKYLDIMKNEDENIVELQNEGTHEDYTEVDKKEYVARMMKNKECISDIFNKIIDSDYAPILSVALGLEYGCYLFECLHCENK